ncbi:MAG: hypothetical protein KC420_05855 [Myxococcales bacterium]|nr:hypothetical protein [Myxococcales bacterium]
MQATLWPGTQAPPPDEELLSLALPLADVVEVEVLLALALSLLPLLPLLVSLSEAEPELTLESSPLQPANAKVEAQTREKRRFFFMEVTFCKKFRKGEAGGVTLARRVNCGPLSHIHGPQSENTLRERGPPRDEDLHINRGRRTFCGPPLAHRR